MKNLFLIVALLASAGAWTDVAAQHIGARQLVPIDRTQIYRRSFTARYDPTGPEPVREAAFSPDSTLVGFVRDNDLHIRQISDGRETQITFDGARNHIINGATDWVYEEEYAFTRAWEFSPDGRRIAYLRFDESAVPEFSMMRYDGKLYPEPYTFKYPKAGETNSTVTLWVYDIHAGRTVRVDTGFQTDQYIPRIGWTPAGELFFYRVNRLQNHFEVLLAEGGGSVAVGDIPAGNDSPANSDGEIASRVIYSETSPTYVERPDASTVEFLPDGDRFVVRSETKAGWWRDYLYSIEKGFIRELAPGKEERRAQQAPDPAEWNARIEDGREFFSFTTEPGDNPGIEPDDPGVELYGWMIKPENFDPRKQYPVLMTQYSGPGSESVFVEGISAGDMAIYRPLLEAGYIVACVDPRGTGGRGEAFKKSTYGNLGKLETEDQIAAARWLGSQPWVDASRIGIYGWSYGGFIALNSILKGADVFALAVAVAPVTSWRFYDTIYTEIYNGLPADNPKGYDDNSPINYAHLLRGKLLIVHGTGDDNVHVQNTLEMTRALVAADRQFDMMTYTDDNHSMQPSGGTHVRRKIADYIKDNL